MFCSRCGKELKEGDIFCSYCGAAKVPRRQETEVNGQEEQIREICQPKEAKSLKKKKGENHNLLLAFVCIFLLIVILAGIIAIFVVSRSKTDADVLETSKEDAGSEKLENENIDVKESVEVEVSEESEENYQLLVCVPADYMSLRSSPGLGDDVIAELKAGTYLKWYGEAITDNEKEFYKVVVRDSGQEGYVSARFCVQVEFEPNEDEMNVVETDNALYTYDMMVEDIEELCQKYSDRLSYNIIGISADGRNIYEVILGNADADNHIMMQAAIHGREYMTAQLVMKMLEYYSYYYETAEYENIPYKDLFSQTAIHIVPMTNPDGITISQLGVNALNDSYYANLVYECYERDKWTLVYEEDSNGDMNWSDYYRQENFDRAAASNTREITFEEYQTIWKANANGVDLNNNFDAGWEEIELKEFPAYGSFKGYFPESETESTALVDLALQHDYRCFISYHSRGQLIYYDVLGNTPENSQASADLAGFLDNWIKYEPVNTNKGYNVNLGGFGDWVQLYLNKPSVTIESGKKPCPLEIEEFPSIWYRHRESWAMLCKQFYS